MHFDIIIVPVDTGDLPNFRIFLNVRNEEATKNVLFCNSGFINCEIRLFCCNRCCYFLSPGQTDSQVAAS